MKGWLRYKFDLFDYIVDRHDFSLLWSSILMLASIALMTEDIPSIIKETLPYNGFLTGTIGIFIGLFKYIGIRNKNFYFHSIMDFSGATWFIFMGMVTTSAIPPMMFTGVILLTCGIMVDIRLVMRALKHKNIKR